MNLMSLVEEHNKCDLLLGATEANSAIIGGINTGYEVCAEICSRQERKAPKSIVINKARKKHLDGLWSLFFAHNGPIKYLLRV